MLPYFKVNTFNCYSISWLMAVNEIKLNLARKWRSQRFDDIVGQDLCVRMLKNSLYKGQFFPVYLLCGQRGCGKTTTARVFAAAINCQKLSLFQSNPQINQLPCLACESCVAMLMGKHPDFIEMDAASHTGVDNVRTIIEASSYLPVMGNKKIYLIDEAHMLSKAAFNALLKVLEEPPASVIFMLATTDPHKIIDTVRSRCFQLIFRPIQSDKLIDHLAMVCDAEGVAYEKEGLALLVSQAEGSARDALNLVEQVRFANSTITSVAVRRVLGRLDDALLIAVVEAALCKGPADLLRLMKEVALTSYSPEYIWQRLSDLARAMVWQKHGVDAQLFDGCKDLLYALVGACSLMRINQFLQALYDHELLFFKTTAKHSLIEMILLQLCGPMVASDTSGGASSAPSQAAALDTPIAQEELEEGEGDDDQEDEDDPTSESDDYAVTWQHFIKSMDPAQDPLVYSIISQGIPIRYDTDKKEIAIEFPKNLIFFTDLIADMKAGWYAQLCNQFGHPVVMQPLFTGPVAPLVSITKKIESVVPAAGTGAQQLPSIAIAAVPIKQISRAPVTTPSYKAGVQQANRSYKKSAHKNYGPVVDVSDAALWQKTQVLLRYFPGTIHEIME
jgi:DNA polymerase III subunit gamma/tau